MLAAVMLLALLVRLAVPAGFMLAPAGAGLAVVPCGGIAMPAAHHGRGHGMPADDEAPGPQPCAFAGAVQAPLPDVPAVAVAIPISAADTPTVAPAIVAAFASPGHLRPPPRGPPVRA